jgi:O-antigen ligase
MYVSSWASIRRPFTVPRHRTLYRASMVAAALLLLISLSRSILVAAAIWPLLSLIRALLTGRVSPRQQIAVVVGAAGAGVLALTGFLSLLWIRFTEETDSYDTREDLIGLALERIQENFWTGGIDVTRTSSHNFALDMWQRGGIFTGLPAVFIFLFISLLWLQLLLRVRTISDELFPLVAAMALPCVRLVTQGGGSLQIVEWVTLAFVLGILAAARETAKRAAEADLPIASDRLVPLPLSPRT